MIYFIICSFTDLKNYTRLYLGCHWVNVSAGELFPSGLPIYTETDERICIKTCSMLNYDYSAIQSGLMCFCSNKLTSNLTDNQMDCLVPFFSDKWYLSEVAMRFYRVPTENVKVEKFSLSHHKRRIGEGLNITASVNSDNMGLVRFTVQSGDGNEYVFCDPKMRHFYTNPGNYSVSLIVKDIKGNTLTFTDSIEVADNLTKPELECPRAVPQGEAAECKIKLARALNVTGKVTVENREITLHQYSG